MTQRSPWLLLPARVIFLAYVFFTSAYCLLAYIPFTYQQVHVGELLPWLTRLTLWHAWLFWPAFACALLTLLPERRQGIARLSVYAFIGLGVAAGVALAVHPLLPNLSNDRSSLVLCLASLTPLICMAAIDLADGRKNFRWRPADDEESGRIFVASFQTALFATAIYFLIVVLRIVTSSNLDFEPSRWASVLLWSVLSHLLVFFLIFAVIDLGLLAASFLDPVVDKALAAAIASIALVVALVALALRAVIFPPLAFEGFAALLAAFALAACVMVFAVGTSIRLLGGKPKTDFTGLQLLVRPLAFVENAHWSVQPGILIVLALFAWLTSVRVSKLDWGFVVQKLIVMVVWSVAFAVLYNSATKWKPYTRLIGYSAGVAVLLAYTGITALQPRTSAENNAPTEFGQAIESFSGYDVSFRLADQVLRPQVTAHTGESGNFYSYLAENTNIPRSVHVEPVDIRLVSKISPTSGAKPHIFFIVIDSLRRDYLSPYNGAVDFTPNISAFAHDSVTFQNAFTRYGGTGLSEPSIWVGGEMLHQQYESPFGSMNSLQKLLEADHYREWISKDNILQQVVPSSTNIDELDKQIGTMHYDLCTTLEELTQRIATTPSSGNPIFVYTQAQNIHVSVIDREGRTVPSGESYPAAFNAAYASRLHRIDSCFGTFVDTLKRKGIYDDSLIVLTSDHGDSLGESGRWGHAYTIFPEIVRIPLIVHMPAVWRNTMQSDPQGVAFLTDLTPSLYYLLGERPVVNSPVFGHPLFTATIEEQRTYQTDSQLLVSSYGPVYGLLSDNGRHLYIADGVNYRDYAYDLDPDGGSRETALTEDQRTAAQRKIREQVGEISRFYGWH